MARSRSYVVHAPSLRRRLASLGAELALLIPVLFAAGVVMAGEPVSWELGVSTLALGAALSGLALHRERRDRMGR